MTAAERTIEINAAPMDCYKVIADFGAYPEFVGDLKSAKILEKKGETWRVEFSVSIIKEIRYTLDLTGTPGKGIEWKQVKGFFKKNDGGWKLEKLGPKKTRATYMVDIEMGPLVPKTILKMLVEKNFPTMLAQFKQRIEGR